MIQAEKMLTKQSKPNRDFAALRAGVRKGKLAVKRGDPSADIPAVAQYLRRVQARLDGQVERKALSILGKPRHEAKAYEWANAMKSAKAFFARMELSGRKGFGGTGDLKAKAARTGVRQAAYLSPSEWLRKAAGTIDLNQQGQALGEALTLMEAGISCPVVRHGALLRALKMKSDPERWAASFRAVAAPGKA